MARIERIELKMVDLRPKVERTDAIQSFVSQETPLVTITEDDIKELTDKAGVRFPISDPTWEDLCYICCWMGLKRELPDGIRNRMMLGEHNRWVKIYLAGSQTKTTKNTVIELFDLAS